MIDVSDDDIVAKRRTSGGRFALFCSTDLPRDCPIAWWSAMLDLGGDAAATLIRLDEKSGGEGWTLLALLRLAAARLEVEAGVKRSSLTRDAAHHIDRAVELEKQRRGDLTEDGELVFDILEPGGEWPWLAAEFGDEGTVDLCPSLTGDEDEGVNLELILLVVDQLVKDAGAALSDQGPFGGMAVHVAKALDAIARRDRGLRSRR